MLNRKSNFSLSNKLKKLAEAKKGGVVREVKDIISKVSKKK